MWGWKEKLTGKFSWVLSDPSHFSSRTRPSSTVANPISEGYGMLSSCEFEASGSSEWSSAPQYINHENNQKSYSVEVDAISDFEDDNYSAITGSASKQSNEKTSVVPKAMYVPSISEESSLLSDGIREFIHDALPVLVKGCEWILIYSTEKHGISLLTLLRQSADLPGPCLLVTGDKHGAVFGALLEAPIKPTPKAKYQGTNQTFVFTTRYGEPQLFRSTGANRYYYLCMNDVLAFGGGGNFALRIEGDLLNGSSGPCETFGNLCLAHSSEFSLKSVELWGFAHLSRYL